MHEIKFHEYRGYWVACNAGGNAGSFFDGFTVSKHKDGTPPHQLLPEYQNGLSKAAAFPTEAEAHASATKQAHAWVDAELSK